MRTHVARAELNKRSRDADLSKDKSGPESPPEFWRSCTSGTYRKTRSASKSQKTPSKNKESTHLRRSRRLEDRSMTKEKVRKERSKFRRKRFGRQEASSNSEYKEGGKNSPGISRYTKVEPARNWFDDLDPKSVDSFEELSQKFLEEFSQQKRYAKDPTEIHDIKRRQNEGLQAFMDRFKFKSSHIKGVPPVLRISAFMHGHGRPELAKKLNDKIPKTVDEMFERVRAFIRGEVVDGSEEMVRPPQGDKEILAMEKDPRHGKLKKANRGSSGLGEVGLFSEGNSPEQPAEWEPWKEHNPSESIDGKPIIFEGIVEGSRVRRILVDGGSSSEIMYEHCFRNLDINVRARFRRCKTPMIGVVTIETSRETLRECKHLERVQGSWKEVLWRQREEQMSRIRKQAILRARSNSGRMHGLGPVSLEKIGSKEDIEEVFTISHEHSDQYMTMGATLTTNCKHLLADIL
ncbi:reverse transcriptase domain-containing protein [Tanacetum coccineum]|uniref:Reverse transcriptase domain-containing protein n=1 Tax=Tanacetum coccineum TaxID=301880 RepID=A0ABQ5HX84_9ASTR